MYENGNKSGKIVKGIFITLGVIVAIMAALAIAYKLFRKYFKITLECGELEGDDCDSCELSDDCEPDCCYSDEDDAPDAV